MTRPASGWREIKPSVSLGRSGARRRAGGPSGRWPARRAARRRRAGRHPRSPTAAARAAASAASDGTGARAALVLDRGQRTLPEGDLADTSPAEMGVDPGHDHRGAVLRLEREGAFDPQHEGRGKIRRIGIALRGPGRPLQFDRPRVTRKRLADDGRPVGDQAPLAQASRGQRLGDQSGREFGQPLGAAASALHHGFGGQRGKRGLGCNA